MRGKIIYEDASVLVVYKPAGFPVQTAKIGQSDLVSELKNYLHGSYLGIVHRLDQPVEGLLVFAKTKSVAGELTKQLQNGVLKKQYLAVVCGRPKAFQEELIDYLYKTPDNRAEVITAETDALSGKLQPQQADAKKAVLRYQVKAEQTVSGQELHLTQAVPGPETAQISMLEIEIETGRFHQIRAQLSHAGFPILGDGKYGSEYSKQLSSELGVKHVALCAAKVYFRNPFKKQMVSFEIMPENSIFQKMGIE